MVLSCLPGASLSKAILRYEGQDGRSEPGLTVKGSSFTASTHFERSTLSCKGLGELVIDTSSPPLAGGTSSTRGRAPGARLWFRVSTCQAARLDPKGRGAARRSVTLQPTPRPPKHIFF